MSGFEVAGVVLGSFPLLIEALKFYAEERGVIKDFFNYQTLIQSLLRQLKREKLIFENSTKCLFYAAIKDTDRPPLDVIAMMGSLDDSRWSEEDPNSNSVFSLKIASFYAETRKDLEGILVDIQTSLEKVPPKKNNNKHTTKRQWQRLILAIKQNEIELQLTKLEKLNRFLIDLTRDNVITAISGSTGRTSKHYQPIRHHAIMMAEALGKKLLGTECHCKSSHNACLKLEVRTRKKRNKYYSFNVIFGFDISPSNVMPTPWVSRELEIQAFEEVDSLEITVSSFEAASISSTTPIITIGAASDERNQPGILVTEKKRSLRNMLQSLSRNSDTAKVNGPKSMKSPTTSPAIFPVTAQVSAPKTRRQAVSQTTEDGINKIAIKEIENLCVAISKARDEAAWCGVLTCYENKWHEMRLARNPCSKSETVKVISLAKLLSSQNLNIKPRSKLGLQLASAVMQLHQTPWLNDSWGKEDIMFLQEEDGTVVIDKPFVKLASSRSALANSQVVAGQDSVNLNVPCLFSLGVVLIELHYKKGIDELQNEDTRYKASTDEDPEIRASKRTFLMMRLIENMDAGENFQRTLKHCIKGPDAAMTDLSKEELRDMIEEKIVIPLENEVLWLHACKEIEECM